MGAATVLVVDRNPETLSVVGQMLARSSYTVLTADCSHAALELLQAQSRIDLVISDAVLQEESGLDLVERVKQSSPATAVMLMVAYTDEPLDPTLSCVRKPFTAEMLIRRVEDVLERSRQATRKLRAAFSSTTESIERSRNLLEQTSAVVADSRIVRSRSQQMRERRGMERRPADLVAVLSISPNEEDHTVLKGIFKAAEWRLYSEAKWHLHPVLTLQSATTVLQQIRIPLVLCDTDLSSGGWREIVAQTAALPDFPLVIVSSRMADADLWAEALNLGAYDVLAKPFDAQEVTRILSLAWLHWTATRKPTAEP
jgi:DNA-binding NtrC family response regulator